MRLLVTRPEPDASALKEELLALGHEVFVEPLLHIVFAPQPKLDFDDVQALIATSRNALRALAAHSLLAEARHAILFAVGPGTGDLARSLGFDRVVEGAADAGQLVPTIVSHARSEAGSLLHLAGDRVDPMLKTRLETAGFVVRVETMYSTANATRLSGATASRILDQDLDGVILMSPRTAKVYAALIRQHDLVATAGHLKHFCLSRAVAHGLDTIMPVQVSVAQRPNRRALLALISQAAANCP